jgi:membrane-associated protein
MNGVVAVDLMDPSSLLVTFGMVGVLVTLFAETGLLVGFFLPGDSLLFVTGIAAAGELADASLPLGWLLIGAPAAAVAGAQLGHYWGASLGHRMFDRPESRFYQHAHVRRAEDYFTKFGVGRALVLARFVGVVRTFINPVAGVLHVPVRTFLLWNVVGGILWTDGIILAGYLVGDAIPDIDSYILPIVAVIMLVSLAPFAVGVLKGGRASASKGDDTFDDDRAARFREDLAADSSPHQPLLTSHEARATLHLLKAVGDLKPSSPTGSLARDLSGRLALRLDTESPGTSDR